MRAMSRECARVRWLLLVVSVLSLAGCGSSSGGGGGTTPSTGDAFAGGLMWDNWTKTQAGGTGNLPAGVTAGDFIRCKACHGWDTMGDAGGYVRRSAKATRPNPTPGVDLTAQTAVLTAATVEHMGGRAFVPVGNTLLDNMMPDFGLPEGLTGEQILSVLEFLLNGPKVGNFATINPATNPVTYAFLGASTSNGATLFAASCVTCHPTLDTAGAGPALAPYFARDGKFSEGFHKSVYGIPGGMMTRSAMGDLSGAQVADIMAHIEQELRLPGDPFAGGLVWDNWTKAGAGGTGLPAGVTAGDFVRCKACHGWDAKGDAGGYVRRTASATRPNPTTGVDLTLPGTALNMATTYHAGGRGFPSVGDTATDNTMPNFGATGGLTLDQARDVLAFLQGGPRVGDFATINPAMNPVTYSFGGASAATGATLYATKCAACHPTIDAVIPGHAPATFRSYFGSDGKFSEGFHKAVYGIPDQIMTRGAMGNPTGAEVADILAYIQSLLP